MIWTLRQINEVAALRAGYLVAHEQITRGRGVEQVIHRRVVGQLAAAANTLGVDLDERDVVVASRTEPADLSVRFTAKWWPETREVVFSDGPAAGQIYTWQRLPETVLIQPPLPGGGSAFTGGPVEPLPLPVQCGLSGWNETRRLWVYSVTG